MSVVVGFPGGDRRHIAVHRYEGAFEDRYLVVLVEPDGRWWERSAYLRDRDEAGEIATALAEMFGLRLEPIPMRAGVWSAGGVA
ncbi:hypothetical protein MWN33_05655 [Starkeya koreensis]|uniref:Uncharacterized protein n=1 Tax=Ancylobacter koreensis TaxID=266121 RepID=A0ABT0DJR7_9HYPH|nr:hypothetical protein [Ancylobacter koreensis]MCK0207516.1 hypothetical protein [Ancylobacter koreensis]